MRARLLWALWALAVALVLPGSFATTLVDLEDLADLPYGFGLAVLGVGAATAGAVVSARVPSNAVGPILLALGLGVGLLLSGLAYAEVSKATSIGPLPGAAYAAWLKDLLYIPVIFGLTTFLLLVFPDGHLLTPRWRWVAWFTVAAVSLATGASAFTPRRLSPGFDNPVGASGRAAEVVLALEDGTDLLALPVMVLAALALALRLRRSHGVERQQLKWFTYVAALAGVGLGLSVTTRGIAADLAFLGGLLALAGLPVVAGVAVLRHGLYEIDVVIKRTLVYGTLTASLVATYLALVLLFQLLLRPLAGESDLAVAGSTLAVAALFRPLRAQIQVIVDRRFYRSRYDAARTLDGFAGRLREELDLEALGVDLRRAVHDTMQPSHVSLWLRRQT